MAMETSRRNFLAAAAATVGTAATTPLALAADKFGRDRDWTGDTTVTYPEPAWEVRDKRFTGVQGNATLQRIWHGMGNDRALWCEGPVWMGDWGSLVWSDIPNHRTLRWIEDDGHVSVFQTDSGYSNGHTRDNQGRLIAMEHDTRRVRRRAYDCKLCYVFATGAMHRLHSAPIIIVIAFANHALGGGNVFADFKQGFTDGIRCDNAGHVWCSWGWGGVDTNGVRVHAPSGELLAFLHTPEVVANLCFGGTKRNRLFMTGSTSIYALYVNAVGAALS